MQQAGGGGWSQPYVGGFASSKPGKPGDWMCPQCNDLQFARNDNCRRCGFARPAQAGGGAPAIAGMPARYEKPGDWYCPNCNDLQFARNDACRRCGTGKPQQLNSKWGPPTQENSWPIGNQSSESWPAGNGMGPSTDRERSRSPRGIL